MQVLYLVFETFDNHLRKYFFEYFIQYVNAMALHSLIDNCTLSNVSFTDRLFDVKKSILTSFAWKTKNILPSWFRTAY